MKQVAWIILVLLMIGCSNQDLTEQGFVLQNNASDVVSDTLFDRDLSELTSYHVRKNGEVVILFAKQVSSTRYIKVVNYLR
ncbi:hypothetical protein [Abyssogena phaseoliformis symbiont]|uniref:hypothetical protein n=1 Tax=Abyssogena phaseoliformis symbiont TaxID=596095 RepID=UPI001914ED57|nr:hypothetical protein [Abyssogena phaseoliformis symbiont]